ncbi:DUF943 family protein [Klebsiella sp. Ap-873]|uniref:Membrane protein n=1 Tax=Cedecea neteri TaxID=158822 RepID=A0AAN0VSL6_9ENTR|nr:DUF943 family protein [Cedecea neteri]AIR59906.1 membrane protein [Cedecea neteri]NIG79467.1 DUF943 family protein [Klebsiella sp. Ap-873]
MTFKNKKVLSLLVIASCVLAGYLLWESLRPVEIVAVHYDGNYSDVLVKNFPFTSRGKINWWLENKEMLKAKYDIPRPASYGGYTIIFWLFGEGYKEEGKYDRLCFDDMKTKVNCIEKDSVFRINYSKNAGLELTVNGSVYRLEENGNLIKIY